MSDSYQKFLDAYEKIRETEVCGETGGGMVKAYVKLGYPDQSNKVTKVEIDEKLFKPDMINLVEDLVVGAVNVAIKKIDDELKSLSEEIVMGLNASLSQADPFGLGGNGGDKGEN